MSKARIFRIVLFTLVAGLLAGLPMAIGPAEAADAAWQAQYWNNRTLTGTPVRTQSEANIDYNWGQGSPAAGVNVDNFSARWTRVFNLPAGLYRFQATVDDGVRVWVDGTVVIDAWNDSATRTLTGEIVLPAGDHTIKMEYYEAGGDAVARLSWTYTPPQPGTYFNWKGEYFNNMTLSGSPVLVRDDARVEFDWGGGAPDGAVPADRFSVRWTRTVNFSPGRYKFMASADDGLRLWVNGALLIDRWFDQQAAVFTAEIDLSGNVPIQVEYFENTGGARVMVSWGYSGSASGINNWRGEYFNNTSLSGSPNLVRDDGAINFNWGTGAPAAGINADRFSVRWTRTVNFNAGRYRFTVKSDDGVRLWVNNVLLVDRWYDQQAVDVHAEIDLSGNVPVKVEYFENQGDAQISMGWLYVGGSNVINNWRGEYFNNANLSGNPSYVRDDANVNFNWGTGAPAPGINVDNFSVRWTRNLNFTSGRYRFTATSDDGVRVYVHDRLVINNWSDHAAQTVTGELDLAGGSVPIKVEYYDRSGIAQVVVSWTAVSAPPTTPPPPVSAGTAVVTVADYLNVRSGPGVSYNVLTQVYPGQIVTLTGYRNSATTWVEIITPGNVRGWSNASFLWSTTDFKKLTSVDVPPPTSGMTATVNAYFLNVRSGPATSHTRLTTLTQGMRVNLTGFRNADASWVQVKLDDDRTGWVSSRYLTSTITFSTLTLWTG